jgi:3-dehydroquinate dehydratase/shikimate dehydrogenase
MTYLTVPIAAKNVDEGRRQIDAAVAAGAEMLELRCDYLRELSVTVVEKLIGNAKAAGGERRGLPVIVTCRDEQQGGANAYPVKLRVEVLAAALKAGAEYVDFEYENFLRPEHRGKIMSAVSQSLKGRLILSAHNFKGRFEDIARQYRHIQTLYPAAVPKLVYTAGHINDCFEAFDLMHRTSGERIVFCMGQAGLISRIIAKKLGSLVTFASLEEKHATAAGQLTIQEAKEWYRMDKITFETELYGVIASPVEHSLSPAVHNACFARIGVDKLYLPLWVEGGKSEFDEFMNNVISRGWLGFKGFSVTIPHKASAISYVKKRQGVIEPLAEKIGAVNTLTIAASQGEVGKLKINAYNTDYAGALEAITSALKIRKTGLKGMAVAVIGAGGAARAIVAGLCERRAKVKIYNRTIERGENLAAEFGCLFAPLDELASIDAKLVINCTSIGMYPKTEETPLPKECLKEGTAVFDTVYNPAETLLLKHAKGAGAKTIDGLSMFINQACLQFKLFTGKKGDAKLMQKTILSRLSQR